MAVTQRPNATRRNEANTVWILDRLIAVSLVSSVNGHMENMKALSDIAHAHKAYLFGDIIQGCGGTPIDVKAMGIKEDLAGSVVKPTEFTGHPDFNYAPWTTTSKPGPAGLINHAATGVAAFDCGTPSVITYAAQHEAFKYIEKIGIANIRAHADRSIATFLCKDAEAVRRKIRASKACSPGPTRRSRLGASAITCASLFPYSTTIRTSIPFSKRSHDRVRG